MKFKVFEQGELATNSILVEKDGCCVIVDIPYGAYDLIDYVLQNNLKVQGILLTHGHFDHCGGVQQFITKCFCPNVDVFVHKDDEQLCLNAIKNAWGVQCNNCQPTRFVSEGYLQVGNFTFGVMETPGHTQGSVVYLLDGIMFSGDTLFQNSVGRTDLLGGDANQLKHSLQKFKLFSEDFLIYTGHGPCTFLQWELKDNPFLN